LPIIKVAFTPGGAFAGYNSSVVFSFRSGFYFMLVSFPNKKNKGVCHRGNDKTKRNGNLLQINAGYYTAVLPAMGQQFQNNRLQ
jgi:hypothetical protein